MFLINKDRNNRCEIREYEHLCFPAHFTARFKFAWLRFLSPQSRMHVAFWFGTQKIMVNQCPQQGQSMKSNYDLMKNSKQESLNNNFQIPKSMLDNSSTQRQVAALLGKYLLTLGKICSSNGTV